MTDRADLALAEWRRERPDLDPWPMAVLGRLAGAALLVMHRRLMPVFAAYGLQSGEFDVLATLRRAGAPHALTPTDLYGATMLSSGGMTARIDRLEKAGLVERRANPADRRGTLVALTEKGRALIDEAVTAHVANEAAVLSALTKPEQEELHRLLGKLIAGLGAE